VDEHVAHWRKIFLQYGEVGLGDWPCVAACCCVLQSVAGDGRAVHCGEKSVKSGVSGVYL